MLKISSLTVTPIRVLQRAEDTTWPDDPPKGSTELAGGCWRTSGESSRLAVYVAACDANDIRVLGVTATVETFFFTPAEALGAPKSAPDMWHSNGLTAAFPLDEVAVVDCSKHGQMGVRLSSIVDGSKTAVRLYIAVQEMPE